MAHIAEQILVWEIEYLLVMAASPGATEMLYLSTRSFTTVPGDTPANTFYDGRIIDPGSVKREIFQGDATTGRCTTDYGYVELANTDGALDFLHDVVWGFPAALKILQPGSERIDTATTLMSVIVIGVESDDAFRTLRLRIRDRMAILDNPIQTRRYLGTGGAEGGAGLANVLIPGVFGQVWEAPAILVDAVNLIYQVSNGPTTFDDIRDGGLALTDAGSAGSTYGDLVLASPVAGTYVTASAVGMFRLGATPAFDITVDCLGSNFTSSANAGDQVYELLKFMGIDDSEIDLFSLSLVNNFNNSDVGIYLNQSTPAIDAISFLADSIGASLIYSFRSGVAKFKFVWLDEPTGILPSPPLEIFASPDYYGTLPTYTLDDIIQSGFAVSLSVGPKNEGNGRPVFKVIIKYGRNYHPLDQSNMSGAIRGTDAENSFTREWFEREDSLYGFVLGGDLLSVIPDGVTLTFETGLYTSASAVAEATRRLNLYSVRRDRLAIPLSFAEDPTFGDVEIGSQVIVQMDRFGYDAYSPVGKPFLVIGRKDDYKSRVRTLILWG